MMTEGVSLQNHNTIGGHAGLTRPDIIGGLGLSLFFLFFQLNATVSYIGLLLTLVVFAYQANLWKPLLKQDPAALGYLLIIFYILGYCLWAEFALPETAQDQRTALIILFHWLLFIPVGWQIFWQRKYINILLSILAIGLLIRILVNLNWADISNGLSAERTGFGMAETVFAPIAGSIALGFLMLSPRMIDHQVDTAKWLSNLKFFVGMIGFLIILESLVLSQTRGVWLAAALVFPIALLIRYKKYLISRQFFTGKSIIALIFLFACGGLFLYQNHETIVKRINSEQIQSKPEVVLKTMEGQPVLMTTSVGYRRIIWAIGFHKWLERPFLGWGPGSTESLINQANNPVLSQSLTLKDGTKVTLHISHLHNLYLELLVRFGALGTLIFLALPVLLIANVRKAQINGRVPWDYACFIYAGWVFLAIMVLFDFQLFKFAWRNYCVIWAGLTYAVHIQNLWVEQAQLAAQPVTEYPAAHAEETFNGPERMKKPSSKHRKSSIAIYRRLIGYGMPYWKIFAVSVVSMSIYAMLGPAFAKLIQPLIDGSFIQNDPTFLRKAPAILLGLSLIRGITGFLGDYCSGLVGRRIIADMRRQLFDQFLNLPCEYYDRASSGELLSKLLYNTEQVAQAMTEGAVNLIKDGLSMVGLTALMVYENVQLSMIFLIVGPILGVSVRKITLRFRKISSRIQDSMGSVGHVTQEVIEAQRIVKVFNGKAYETIKFAKENEHNQKQQMKLITTNAMSGSVIQLIYVSGFAAILYVVSIEAVRQTITPGSLIAFIAAMAMMQSPIKRFTQAIGVVQKGVAASESIFEMVDMEREKDTGHLELDKVEGRIEYRHVSLEYRDRQEKAIDDLSLNVPSGKTIALVGQSGSGKTSLIRLLPRLYEATEGQILIDGHDIRDFTLENLRKHVAYVGQEVTLFNDTVANNIAYGCRDQLSLQEIKEAARAAYALDFIEDLPQGFDTQVGQQGIVLSGGQRQRIAIARALLKNAPILILDEATSALDAESERYVQDALEVLMRNRTTLIVAHRLSTIQNADKIYVLRAGCILESGTHDELMGRESFYAELNRMQFNHALEG